MMLIDVEISQLKNQVKELEQENATLRIHQKHIQKYSDEILSFIDSFPCHIWKSSVQKDIIYINKSLLNFIGCNNQKLYNKELLAQIHPNDIDYFVKSINIATEEKEFYSLDYRIKNKEGSYKWFRNIASPCYKDNKFTGFIGLCQDISIDKENEQKLTSLIVSRDQFFSVIAHDLRGPFNSILGFSELLADSSLNFNQQKTTEIGKHLYLSAKKTLSLLENLLEWGRLQSNHITFLPVNINLKNVCSAVIDNTVSLKNRNTFRIVNDINPKHIVYSDINMLQSIFRNLINNSLKFMTAKGVIIVTSIKTDNKIQISVQDNGQGIEKNRIKTLFNIDQKYSSMGINSEKGTGLGLVLCKEFVEKNGGEIRAESILNKGSKFIFTLPIPQSSFQSLN